MNASIGFRFWADRFSHIVLAGTVGEPHLVSKEVCKCPRGYSRAECLSWLRKEIGEILNKHKPAVAFFKATEGNSRTKDMDRAQFEGVAIEAAWSMYSLDMSPVTKAQVKKKTGFVDKAKYVQNLMQQKGLSELGGVNYADAALAAMCGLSEE